MKEKGQALVEFILILPIILLILVALIDIGNIFLQKYNLNNDLETITDLYKNNKTQEIKAYIINEGLSYEEKANGDLIQIILKKPVKITAPVLSNILGNNYTIETSKNIYPNSKVIISEESFANE